MYFTRRIGEARQAILDAEDFDAASRAILELAARWTPDALASLLGDALELAALSGREAVFADQDDPMAFADALGGVTFREQIAYLTQKRPKPTKVWTDAMHGDHDRAFVIAGATNIAMLEEFQAAVIEAASTRDIKAFGKEFDRIVEKYGWSYNGGRDWRVRTIFNTNIRTSYMAGRLKQMRDPDVVKLMPWWQYIHADTRVPLKPRPEHVGWDHLILRWDDPWWDKHFPPNDWQCSCGVRSLSDGQLKRLGKAGPDQAPPDSPRPFMHNASGQTVMLPEGIGFGWDHMPGDLWERGLVPSALLDDPLASRVEDIKGQHLVAITEAGPIEDLIANAKPFDAKVMPPGLPIEDYIAAFLEPFGAKPGEAVLWQDAAGGRVIISDQLFRRPDGSWKGNKRGHGDHAAQLAEALLDPDEIWMGLREVPVEGFPGVMEYMVTRSYIRLDPDTALFALFEIGRRNWLGVTGYASFNRSKPDFRYLDGQRIGKLIWKRK